MSKKKHKQTAKQAAEKYAKENYTTGTWAYADATRNFKAGVAWARRQARKKIG